MAENFSVADEILKLKKLLDDGIITQEEFDAKKKELLMGDSSKVKEPERVDPSPVITISPGPTPSPPKKKGMNGCLFAFILTASIIVGISLLLSIIFSMGSASNGTQSSISESSAITEVSQSPEERKAKANEYDEKIWAQAIDIMKAHNNMMNLLVNFSDGSSSSLDVYNYCKKINENLASFRAVEATTENEKSYAKNVETYAYYVQQEAKLIMEYLDNPTTGKLSELEEHIENVQNATSSIAGTRGTFLGLEGFTDEEIAEKANAIDGELSN